MKSRPQRAEVPTKPALRARLFVPMVILLLVLPVASWVLASKDNDNTEDTRFLGSSKKGPWGDLEYVRIAIELPDHYIDVDQVEDNRWTFPGKDKRAVIDFVRACGFSSHQLASLEQSSWETSSEGCQVTPGDELLWSLNSEVRAKLYSHLAQYSANVDQCNAFAYRPDRLQERLVYSGLNDETIALFEKLLYPQQGLLRFADADIVLRKLSSRKERLRFVKTISRRSSLLVKLNITPETDIPELLKYWGGGGRAKDLRPLLESLARVPGGTKIDIAHLLPPFVRQRLYTFPEPDQVERSGQQDCHWTSINFWSANPRPTFPNPEAAAETIGAEYYHAGNGLEAAQLGDIVFLQNKDGVLIHSAVFIADDIVFTKNGAGPNQPWIYMQMEDMLPYYETPGDSISVLVYRRKAG